MLLPLASVVANELPPATKMDAEGVEVTEERGDKGKKRREERMEKQKGKP